jgi:predicted O-linked N-acetylglucosamine transferase (SPINDLY family)
VNTAVRLAENVGELKKIKSKIMVNKKILSDVNTYANNLERAYSKIYNMYLGNEKIENVYIN